MLRLIVLAEAGLERGLIVNASAFPALEGGNTRKEAETLSYRPLFPRTSSDQLR